MTRRVARQSADASLRMWVDEEGEEKPLSRLRAHRTSLLSTALCAVRRKRGRGRRWWSIQMGEST